MGYVTYKRTYARKLSDESNRTEEWLDTIQRVIDATDSQLGVGFTPEEKERLKYYHTKLKGFVAGRFLWQLGTQTVNRLGLASLQNCAFTTVDKPEAFTWAFDMLMLGCGVGFNIQREYVYKLPKIRNTFAPPVRQDNASAEFIVPDTREGWVELLHRVLRAAFVDSKNPSASLSTYSTHCVRGKGAPIKGFGGVASGPEELCWGIGEISKILEARKGKQLRPIDCLDIMNIVGAVVVSGNVRRSAQIAIGDCDDIQFLRAKRWDLGNIPNWRSNSNNSVVCNDFRNLPEEFWEGYKGNGEPYGLINLRLTRSCGRLGETQYPDPRAAGYNPCAEQPLVNKETCALAEIVLCLFETYGEFIECAKLLYRIVKHSLALDCHHRSTAKVVHKNFRMGIGITGVFQATKEQLSWLDPAYKELRKYDAEYSKSRGFPASIKLTTVKPSGTLSLLPGVTPGAHPGYSHYHIRRIRISSDSELVNVVREHGYPVEYVKRLDGTDDHGTVVASFPMSFPEGTTVAKDVSAIDQLKFIKFLQSAWSDNSVSCTVYYRMEELEDIKKYLAENYDDNHKSLSFLLHSDHGFVQAPLEEITEEQYNELVSKCRILESFGGSVDFDSSDECAAGVCPIR